MKLSYYSYYIASNSDSCEEIYQVDLGPFLRGFCSIKEAKYKNKFKSDSDENLYLFYIGNDIFLYVMTKNHEIIKTIDTQKIDVSEIYDKLSKNEQLGFASYIYIQDCYYGIAATMLGPKNKSLVEYINNIIKSVGLSNYSFESVAMMHQSSKAEVLKLPFIGKTTIEVSSGSKLFQYLVEFAALEPKEINSFVVEIKPVKKGTINKSFSQFSSKINDDGLLKYIVRAKANQEETLEDYYIACMGGVADAITGRDDKKIYAEIPKRVQANPILASKLGVIRNDPKFSKETIQSFIDFSKPDTWTNYFSDL